MKGMTLRKLFLGLFLACIMQGCAFNDYEGTAQRAALANICEQEGFVSYREFAYYTSFQLGEYAHQNMQQVDDNKLNSMYLNEVEKFKRYNLKSPESRANLRTACANVAVVAERVRPKNSYQGQQLSVTDSLNQMGSSAYQSGNQALQQVNSYPPPTVTPLSINPLTKKKSGTPVYNVSECVGAVVNGGCTGTINQDPNNVLRQKCYGIMINGECQGTLGY